ncbi:hypothetical protein [Tropicimonas sp. IMCC34043]|uniref:hypothetical protein n=1 Tax=Tropicimonas sp. IMCC34043 TaxID=2248760 RepID=UPI001E48B8D2|nr:hypothetical protein [Tropicimonas sp. IMCC34043]
MQVTIRPDPSKPLGGYARIELDTGLDATEVTVAVRNVFSGQFLGEDGWQPTREAFGPYPVVAEGSGSQLTVGPEIVNQIEEYTAIELFLGDAKAQTSWPDDVVPAPGAARLGGISSVNTARRAEPSQALRAPVREPEDPGIVVDPAPEPTAAPEPTVNRSRTPMLIGGGLLLVLLAVVLGYLFLRPKDVPPPPPPPPPVPDVCSAEALATLSGGPFAAVQEVFATCGAKISADDALGLLESAAAAGDGAALTLFGKLYDSAATDPVVEQSIGLSFDAADARAAEYYSRAVAAGASEAAPLLSATCERLAGSSATLDRSAHEDFCQ